MKETEIKAIEFIKNTLKNFIQRFPQTRVRYEYNAAAVVHTIEVVPNDVYHLNEQYLAWENDFTDEFITRFPDQNIGFISDDALVGIDKIDFELKGKDYCSHFSTNKENTLIQEEHIRVYTDYEISIDVFNINTSLKPFNNGRVESYNSDPLTVDNVNAKFEINSVCIENSYFSANINKAA